MPYDCSPSTSARTESASAAFQQTLAAPVACSGIGVHSGNIVSMRLNPADPDTGFVFLRTDLKNGARAIPARWDHVVDTRLCTVVGNDHGGKVATIEHLMAALAASGIDNAVIEIDGAEVPVMDGSSDPFMDLIDSVGVAAQSAPRRSIVLNRAVSIVDGDKRATLTPADAPTYSMMIDFNRAPIFRQSYDFAMSRAGFRAEIGRARTFGFMEDLEKLKAMGLGRGASLDNAVGIQDDKVLNEGGLRYADEFVRHKLLDAIGDIALAGAPILARFEAERTGHALNNQLLRALFADPTAWRYDTVAQ